MSRPETLEKTQLSEANPPLAANDKTYAAGEVVHAENKFGGKNDGLKDNAQAPTQDFDNGPYGLALSKELRDAGIDPASQAAQDISQELQYRLGGNAPRGLSASHALSKVQEQLLEVLNAGTAGTGSDQTERAIATLREQRGMRPLESGDGLSVKGSLPQNALRSDPSRSRKDTALKTEMAVVSGKLGSTKTPSSAANDPVYSKAQAVSRLDSSSSQPA